MTAAPGDAEQAQLGPSYDGTVVLDIGGDVGALMILTDAGLHLAEIELSRVDGGAAVPPHLEVVTAHTHDDGHEHTHDSGGPRTHVAVRERRGPSGVRYAAIYPGLFAGEYTLWNLDGTTAGTTTVVGGEVTTVDWR